MAGARIDEIVARKLPQKLKLERPVWMKQIEDSCTRYGSSAVVENPTPMLSSAVDPRQNEPSFHSAI